MRFKSYLHAFDFDEELISTLCQIGDEVERAEIKHPPLNSAHEAYSVILEELDEFWDQVKKKDAERDIGNMRTEMIQTAAMCVRTIRDLALEVA